MLHGVAVTLNVVLAWNIRQAFGYVQGF